MIDFSNYNFSKIMDYPPKLEQVNLSNGFDEEKLAKIRWGAGGYNEKRKGIYLAPHFEGKRYIHMGIDIWAEAGKPVYSFYDGEIAYARDNNRQGDYGGFHTCIFSLAGKIRVKRICPGLFLMKIIYLPCRSILIPN